MKNSGRKSTHFEDRQPTLKRSIEMEEEREGVGGREELMLLLVKMKAQSMKEWLFLNIFIIKV